MAPSWAPMWSIQTKTVTEEASIYKPKAETIAGLGFRRFSVSMQDWLSPSSLRLGKASELALLSFYVRLHLAQLLVAFVAQFGIVHCI